MSQDPKQQTQTEAVPTIKRSGLLGSSLVVGTMTMLSRVLGLLRDIILAAFIGALPHADAFFVAFKIPQFLRRLFAEGAFSQAFVPVLSEYQSQRSFTEVKALVNRVAGMLGSILLILTGLAVWGAPVIATVFAPGFMDQPEKFQLTGEMIRITFPYLFLISMTGFAGAILNSYGRFAVPAFTPVLLNLSLIAAALWLADYMQEPVMALAWGVFIAGCVQLSFQAFFLRQIHLFPRPILDPRDQGVKRIMLLMVPALFGVSVSQINLLLDTVLASFLPNGSVSWLYYSDRLAELPLGVFAIAISTVILPSLSRKTAEQSGEAFTETMDWALRTIFLIALPATVALVLLAKPILITLFHYGKFTSHDIVMASYSMRAYALGLLAFMMIKVLAPGFYARQDMKTPVRIGIIAMVANMVFNIVLVVPLHIYFALGHMGLALATALSAYLNAGLLLKGLKQAGAYHLRREMLYYLLRYAAAVVVMIGILLSLLSVIPAFEPLNWWLRVVYLLLLCVAGLVGYLVSLWVFGLRLSHFRGIH